MLYGSVIDSCPSRRLRLGGRSSEGVFRVFCVRLLPGFAFLGFCFKKLGPFLGAHLRMICSRLLKQIQVCLPTTWVVCFSIICALVCFCSWFSMLGVPKKASYGVLLFLFFAELQQIQCFSFSVCRMFFMLTYDMVGCCNCFNFCHLCFE